MHYTNNVCFRVVHVPMARISFFILLVGRHSLCQTSSQTAYNTQVDSLIASLTTCKNELAQLNTTLFSEFTKFDNFETYKGVITELIDTNADDLNKSQKYKGFLEEYDSMFCK